MASHNVYPRTYIGMSKRFNIQLDDERAGKLEALAMHTHVQPGTLARSMLCAALDQTAPDPATIVNILDALPGAFERHQQGLGDARAGKSIPLDDL